MPNLNFNFYYFPKFGTVLPTFAKIVILFAYFTENTCLVIP